MQATFMPKPFGGLTGSGLHLHLSLWAGDDPLFVDPDDPGGFGMSALAYQFIAGLLAHARAASAITCPTVNSYKRMGAAAPSSGATWAPSYIAWGGNNRTHLLRIPEPGRVEDRGVDGAANPYLAIAALAAAGLDGVDRDLDPGPPNLDNLHDLSREQAEARGLTVMPPTLLHAAEELVTDAVLREALGKTRDGDYVDYYASVKRDEFMAFHARITPWELETYLTSI